MQKISGKTKGQTNRQCPNGHGAMNRCFVKINKTLESGTVKQTWISIPWQYCTVCKMMLVDG